MNAYELPQGTPAYVAPILNALEAQRKLNEAWTRLSDAEAQQIAELWKDNAELRDEIHALANRIEALTNFVVSDPAEVAAKIVTDANRATLREVRQTTTCGECGRDIYFDMDDGTLPHPVRNASDDTLHTCHVRAVES